MGQLLPILANMASIAETAGAVTTGYPKPPEAPPAAASLPALWVRPSFDEPSEIEWGASREDTSWQLTMFVFVTPRGEDLPEDFSAVVPVQYDVRAAFYMHSDLGLAPYVSGLHPTSVTIGPLGYLGETYLGATITWRVQERLAVTLS